MSHTSIELTSMAAAAQPATRPESDGEALVEDNPPLGRRTTIFIYISITGVTAISALIGGQVTIALPRIARDLDLPASLLLWPASVYALTCGCTLIVSGAVADVIGSRTMYLIGCLLQSVFTLACGLAQNAFQLIFFRALAGIAIAFCLPSAVSLVTTYFPHGKRRNLAFAAMGGGQPVGFSVGLTISGVLIDSPAGWRAGFYIAAAINTLLFFVTLFGLPKIKSAPVSLKRLKNEVDWIGAVLLSAALGLLSYVFAAITGSVQSIHQSSTIACLTTSLALFPVFVLWVGRQERLSRPALIPNSIWRNSVFTSICIDVFLLWGAFNASETLLAFFFQDVQLLGGTQTSLRFLPAPVVGAGVNIAIGLVIHRIRANWAVVLTALLSAISPILTAVMSPKDSYWEFVFPAVALNVVGPDVLYTVSNLVITNAFPDKTQALAGGVFNTVAQLGKSVGLALSAAIANSVSIKMKDRHPDQQHPYILMQGYRAAWWYCFGIISTMVVVSIFGLRNIGKLGVKRD